ncbi:MAG: NfeD family protein [Planctomycetaceae bacterium]
MPDAGVLATILLIVGLFLLALELMIPSFGIIGLLSALALLVSAWSAWQAWWGTSPGFFWTYAGFWVLGIPSVLGGVLFLLQNTKMGDYVVLRGPAKEEMVPLAEERSRLETLIGKIGTASSLLTPGGMVTIDGNRFHAESPGMVVESGSAIQVMGVKANRLVVKLASEVALKAVQDRIASSDQRELSAESLAATVVDENRHEHAVAQSDSRSGDDDSVLDFDIPDE